MSRVSFFSNLFLLITSNFEQNGLCSAVGTKLFLEQYVHVGISVGPKLVCNTLFMSDLALLPMVQQVRQQGSVPLGTGSKSSLYLFFPLHYYVFIFSGIVSFLLLSKVFFFADFYWILGNKNLTFVGPRVFFPKKIFFEDHETKILNFLPSVFPGLLFCIT